MSDATANGSLLAPRRAFPVQTYAKGARVLVRLLLVAGGFGEAYVPSKLVVASVALTNDNCHSQAVIICTGTSQVGDP